jgi:hypothetical protein
LRKVLYSRKYNSRVIKELFKYGALVSLGFLVIASSQIAVWKYLYDSWIAVPQGSSFFNLTKPHLWSFLFSGYHGMFLTHPMSRPGEIIA